MKENESGRSMLEMLGVLAIIGVLSIGGITGYSKAMGKHRVNKCIDQVTQIVSATRALFYGHKTYAALDNTLIAKAHLFPDELGTGTGSNPFSGNVTLAPASKNGKANKAFTISYTTIPEESCIDLAIQDWGKGSRSGLLSIKVNSTEINNADIATAATACSGDSNTIQWTFY